MKKLIAILVVFAMAMGVAFAQPSVGGNMKISAALLNGSNAEHPWTGDEGVIGTGGSLNQGTTTGAIMWDVHTNVSWQGDNAGGMMRLWSKTNEHQPDMFAFWWWRPVQAFRIQVGTNPDGDWGFQEISGWGFNGEAQGGIVLDEWRGLNGTSSLVSRRAGGAWGGGFNGSGIAISLFPIDGLQINWGIPVTFHENDPGVMYLNSIINASYAIEDIGTVKFEAKLRYNAESSVKTAELLVPDLFVYFNLGAIENMGLELGVSFLNEVEDIGIGLGFRYNVTDEFQIRARAGFELPGDGHKVFGIGILPSYNFGAFTAFLNAGMGVNLGGGTDDTAHGTSEGDLDFYINPYIRVGANSGSFYAGFKLLGLIPNERDGRGGDNPITSTIGWEIPIGWNVYF